ncbi:MAG: SDR family NAD(P)-dependent oxidoreductase [Alphaproteobacteria bacterium]|nr:SDR family NAD(P)-dependent oxidoreductase [Alphaproteobacteria bacterium]
MAGLCEGRVCIVTGAGRGIGREYALMLAEEGARVVVNDLGGAADGTGSDLSPADSVVAEIKAKGGEAVSNGSDVSNWDQAKAMIDQAIKTFGKLDVVINNAGILRDRMLVNMTEAEWDAVIKVHLKGTFAPTHHAANYWRELNKETGQPVNGRIINTSSVSGIYGNIGQTNYGAAKQGIAAFSIIAARELRRYGVTVNCIAPGALTRLTENLGGPVTEERKVAMNPKWVAPIAVWLASEESKDVSGRMWEASGGVLAIAEGWHRGPTAQPVMDPKEIGPIALDLVARARKNAGMDGKDLD